MSYWSPCCVRCNSPLVAGECPHCADYLLAEPDTHATGRALAAVGVLLAVLTVLLLVMVRAVAG